ncbi:MAG: 6-phosphogluconolactonase [Pseudomonadota bacterium]
MATTNWHVLADAAQLEEVVAQRILALAAAAIDAHGSFRIVLAGGRTPAAIYRRLAPADAEWSHWQVYFGDERCLPAQDPERNSMMAARAWLDLQRVPAHNIHPIPAELGAEAAARAYRETVQDALPFDLVLLGMGEDGHTASLFPGQVHAADALVVAVHAAPKPPSDRVSLGLAALNAAAHVLVLVTGQGKHAAVERWRRGEDLPVAQVCGRQGVDVYLDAAAAGIEA